MENRKFFEGVRLTSVSQREEAVCGEGHVLLQIFNKDGKEVSRRENRNLVTNKGKILLAHRLFSSTPKIIQYMQLGHSGTAAAATNVALLGPCTTSMCLGLSGRVRASVAAASMAMCGSFTAKWQHTWTATEFAALGLQECALFGVKTIANTGSAAARFLFTLVNKTVADTLKITWTCKVS